MNKRQSRICSLSTPATLLLAGFMSTSANAAFQLLGHGDVVVSDAAPSMASYEMVLDNTYESLLEKGKGVARKTDSFVDNLPLSDALKILVPDKWQVLKSKEIKLDKKVSWDGNKKWTDVLRSIGDSKGYQFLVDWDKKQLVVTKGRDIPLLKVIPEPAPKPKAVAKKTSSNKATG